MYGGVVLHWIERQNCGCNLGNDMGMLSNTTVLGRGNCKEMIGNFLTYGVHCCGYSYASLSRLACREKKSVRKTDHI